MSIMQPMQSMEHSQSLSLLMPSQQYSHASDATTRHEWNASVLTVGEDGQDLSACEQQLSDLKLNDKPFLCRIFFRSSKTDSRAAGMSQRSACAERTSMELEMDFTSICDDEEYCEAIKSDIVHAVKTRAYGCYLYGHGSYFQLRRAASS
mmetsp:Transcript_46727/g.146513  ORF Transcript_46727/g.146513 Transcript_46727/m.146513 type:complete len:150 (-) Transcript_46727:102-551(-)